MLDRCLYHQLDSLLPPLATEDSSQIYVNEDDADHYVRVGSQDFLRLEFLSACKIMQDVDTAQQILPITPHRFYPALFQAIIQKSFYDSLNIKKKHMAASTSLGAFVINWPHETMVLRDLVPPLPSPTIKPNRMTLQVVRERLNMFFVDILQLIPHTFIKRLDISGYYPQGSGLIDLSLLKKYVTLAHNPSCRPHHVKSMMFFSSIRKVT
ncbi:uncharacterized protein [Panulirus ornatus]|uniref:uncharacterized protein isoform X2 n=1 Tax=Panulirus ornatus TaxID=150431 RepID=UPI003A8B2E28